LKKFHHITDVEKAIYDITDRKVFRPQSIWIDNRKKNSSLNRKEVIHMCCHSKDKHEHAHMHEGEKHTHEHVHDEEHEHGHKCCH
jgi:hypothetical protein